MSTTVLGNPAKSDGELKQPAAACVRNRAACSGWNQDQGNRQCCSGYCHVMDVNKHTGFMTGLCEEQCFLDGQDCKGHGQYQADAQCCSGHCQVLSVGDNGFVFGNCERADAVPVPAANPITAPAPAANPLGGPLADPVSPPSCTSNTQACSGWNQNQGNRQCCSGYCHVMDVNKHTGFMTGLCEEQCFLDGQACKGHGQHQADAQCCSGHCNVLSVDGDGDYFGHCERADAVPVPAANPITVPAPAGGPLDSCTANTQACSGWNQNQGNRQCCSGYCHVMDVNKHTGFMTGLCEEQCFLNGQDCRGSSHYEANAECCSGHCNVYSEDAFGEKYGKCQPKPSPAPAPCREMGGFCSGTTIGQADAQCCSLTCNDLVLRDGVYQGLCTGTRRIEDDEEAAPTPAAGPLDSCTANTQACSGWNQNQGNRQCCSGYCHVMDVNKHTGFMTGLCEEQCFLHGHACKGRGQYQADAQCCSGHCNVLSVDGDGDYFGHCAAKLADDDEESAPAPAANPISGPLSCTANTQACSGYTQHWVNTQCCSGYCHVMDVDRQTGFMSGLCEEECFLNGQDCRGSSYHQADAECCSGYCNVYFEDASGEKFGRCQPKMAKGAARQLADKAAGPIADPVTGPIADPVTGPGCTPNNVYCSGASQDEGDNQCCSGYCKFTVNYDHYFTGTCQDRPTQGEVGEQSAPAPAANPINPVADVVTAPVQRQCKANNKNCSGYTQDQGNDKCCSGYCHLLKWNEQTGLMTGLCKEQCYLVGQSCSGKSAYQADADCCSGTCDIKSIDADGFQHGICIKKATPTPAPQKCKAVGRSCAGATIGAADSKCCSGNCNHLTLVGGIFYGTCERACQPIRSGCSGYSHSEANSMCCSGKCGILSTAEDGHMWGRCLLNNGWPAEAKANSDAASLANKTPK